MAVEVVGIRDVGGVDPDQPRVACLGVVGPGNVVDRVAETSQVDDVGIGRIDAQREIQVALVQQRDRVIRLSDVIGGYRLVEVGCRRHSGNVDLDPVLTEILGHEQAVEAAGGRGDSGIEPTRVDGIFHGIAGRGLARRVRFAPGRRWDWARLTGFTFLPVIHVDDQRVADVAGIRFQTCP